MTGRAWAENLRIVQDFLGMKWIGSGHDALSTTMIEKKKIILISYSVNFMSEL